jgi:hypothetical protein
MRQPRTPPHPSKAHDPVPRPDFKAAPPTDEEFAAWCEHPVTQFVATAYYKATDKQREEWVRSTWNTSKADGQALAEKRLELTTRADAYRAFLETNHAAYMKMVTNDQG